MQKLFIFPSVLSDIALTFDEEETFRVTSILAKHLAKKIMNIQCSSL